MKNIQIEIKQTYDKVDRSKHKIIDKFLILLRSLYFDLNRDNDSTKMNEMLVEFFRDDNLLVKTATSIFYKVLV